MIMPFRDRWLCIGGPLAGEWRPAGQVLSVPDHMPVDYFQRNASVTVVIPPRPFIYYPVRFYVPGWVVPLTFWTAFGREEIPSGHVFPGGIQYRPAENSTLCRWCYGRPMEPGMDACSRVQCITNVATLRQVDVMTSADIDGWAVPE